MLKSQKLPISKSKSTKPKHKKLSTAKKSAWHAFSIYVRTRDCLKTTGRFESGQCVTCNKLYPRLGVGCLQAGHFVPGRTGAVLFDERNCHAQCYSCNVRNHGAPHEYWLFMEKTYGRSVIDELLANRNILVKYKVWDYEAIREKYQEMTIALTNPK